MIILGIDPGSHRIGYGVIKEDRKILLLSCGLLQHNGKDAHDLQGAYAATKAIIEKKRPDAVAIEKLFFFKNQKTFSSVLQTRGVLLLAALHCGTRIIELTPLQVKQAVTGSGSSDKNAVAKMAALLVGKKLPKLDDISDAVAIALAGARFMRHPIYPQHKTP